MEIITKAHADDLFAKAWKLQDDVKMLLDQKRYIDVWELDEQFKVGQIKRLDKYTYDPIEAESAPGISEWFLIDIEDPTALIVCELVAHTYNARRIDPACEPRDADLSWGVDA